MKKQILIIIAYATVVGTLVGAIKLATKSTGQPNFAKLADCSDDQPSDDPGE